MGGGFGIERVGEVGVRGRVTKGLKCQRDLRADQVDGRDVEVTASVCHLYLFLTYSSPTPGSWREEEEGML